MYQPNQDIAKLSQRFNAQAQARNSGWFGKPGVLTIWGSKKDKQDVADIIAYAESHSAVARQAMAWARAHNVVFAAGAHKTAQAYYENGLVVLCLPDHDSKNRYIDYPKYAGALVHEIRHAWQDYYGLLGVGARGLTAATHVRTSDHLIANALYEADAYAMGELAIKECIRPHGVKNPEGELRFKFRQWFSQHARSYHKTQTQYLQRMKKPLGRVLSAVFDTFARRTPLPAHAQIDWQLYLSKLGRTFDGFDYIASGNGGLRDMVLREVLSPSRALGQFAMRKKIDVGASALDLADRQRKLQRLQDTPHRMPLPSLSTRNA